MQNIDIFPWNDHFNTGLDTVDQQHKKLVEILNRLASHVAYNSEESDLNTIFDELTNYTLYHFETEEAIWHQYLPNDPLDSDHQAIHQQFIDTVIKLKGEQSTRPLIELAEEALGFLARWLASHILETDRYMAHLIFALKDGLDMNAAKKQAEVNMSGSTRLLIDIILSIYSTLSTNTLHLMRELKIHQKLEKKVDDQDLYHNILLELSTDFINIPLNEIDHNIQKALEKMASYVNADRAYIFDYDFSASTTTNTYEWCAQSITPQIEELQDIPLTFVPGWPEVHIKGEYVLIQDIAALEEGPLREVLFPQGIQSLVTFPLFENSKCTGFVGFDTVKVKHHFSASEISILELFSKLMSNVADKKNKEEVLLLSNKRFEHAELTGNVGSWEYNIETQNYWGSNQAKTIYGATKEATIFTAELVESCMIERKRVHQALVDLLEKGTEYNLEYEINPLDGSSTKIISSIATVEFDDSNKPIKVVGFIQDITELKQTQKQLELSNERWNSALNANNDGVWEWDVETNNIFVSDRWKTMHGFDVNDSIDTISQWNQSIHQEDKVLLADTFNGILSGTIDKFESEYRWQGKDGIYKWILDRGVVVEKNDEGKAKRLIGTHHDISLKKSYEFELIKSRDRAQHYLDIAGSLIIAIDTKGDITLINSTGCDILEGSEDEIVGKNWFQLFLVSNELKTVKDVFSQLMKGNIDNVELVENHIKTLQGNIKLMSWHNSLIYDENSNIQGLLSSARDITQERQLEEELKLEKQRFQLAIEGARDGIWDWNIGKDVLFFNERYETMLGYNVGDLPKNFDAWVGLLHPDDKESASKVVQEYLDSKGKSTYENSFRLRMKDGSWKWTLGRGRAEFDEDGKALRFVGFHTDISLQKEYQDKLDHSAKHDSLTHLPNRFLLSELLTHAMHITKRKDKQLALLFIDLDGFKEVNDLYGHDVGDKVLSVVAQRMNSIVRKSDIVSRLGGDEFVIVLTELKKSEEIIPLLQRLLRDLSSSIKYNEHIINVSASIGVSTYPQRTDIGNEVLLRQADQAMYNAKSSGKNQYQFFNIEASHELRKQQLDILHLREAITKNQLVLYYQPKVNMTNNKVIGFEALLRWKHPINGLVYPDSFLSLVENESSFMIELGYWVLKNAFSQLEAWNLAGLDITLSINVSAHEVQDENFTSYLEELLLKHPKIKPTSVEIEILETSALDNFELTSKTFKACQDLGISIALDDFGTGYASLHYLKNLPMNTLKIDKSFIIDLSTRSQNISIVEASIGLAQAFNSNIIAEGVESEEHGKILLQLSCKIAQGYVISKAMPAEDVTDWIKSWKGFTSWETTKPINDVSKTILHTKIEHKNWINKIESFLENKTSEIPQLSSSHCYLGNWIENNSSKEHTNNPEFELLKELHSELHNYAEKLLLSKEQEKTAGIQKLKELRTKIILILEGFIVEK